MRLREEVILVRALAREGLNISEISRDVGVSRPTVREWIQRVPAWARKSQCAVCRHERHNPETLPQRQYSYLLGVYLGDGTISAVKNKPRCSKLRVFMDSRYPNVIAEVVAAMTAVVPTSRAGVQPNPRFNVVEIHSYSNAWRCLIPQHGPGRKHTRKIELAPWQQTIVDREPEAFVRNLIHSDGCRVMNRVVVDGKDYAYPRYFFSQVSKDIQELFCRSLRQLRIDYTFSKRGLDVSIARRASVARLDSFVGPKS
jgi:hypothetical protein